MPSPSTRQRSRSSGALTTWEETEDHQGKQKHAPDRVLGGAAPAPLEAAFEGAELAALVYEAVAVVVDAVVADLAQARMRLRVEVIAVPLRHGVAIPITVGLWSGDTV